MSREMEEALSSLKVDTSAFKVLCYLSFRAGALQPSEIAEGSGEKASTVRARLTELRRAGLVSATPDGYVSNLAPYDILMKLYRDIMKESRS